jgi:transposase
VGIRSFLLDMLQEGRSSELVEMVLRLLSQLKSDNDRLQLQLARFMRAKFGHRSEKVPAEQLRLFLQQLSDAAPPQPPPADKPADAVVPPLKRKPVAPGKKGRRALPANLPREEVLLEPAAAEKLCTQCGTEKHCIGHERSEVLEYVPGTFKVLVYARAKYACRGCEAGVVIAPVADKPVEGGLPGFGLMSDVFVRKYADHSPLHRIRGIYRRAGVDVAVSSLSNWVKAGAEALSPLAEAIAREVLGSHVVQADDTGLRVLDPEHPKGSRRGHMWAYVGDGRFVLFRYTPDWSAEGPCSFLRQRRGWLQADGYKGYDRLFKGPGATAVEVGCWSHARRYYFDALPKDLRAAVALDYIGKLFDVEREAKAAELNGDERLALRGEKSRPALDALREWVDKTLPAAPPKSPLGQALTYTVNQWKALTRFLEDGRLELDNNGCERALRQVAVGRKNWMFAGSDAGAERAAVMYTLIGTCRLNGVDPWAYLRDVIEKLASGWLQSRLDELLPKNWASQRPTPSERTEPAPAPP